MIDFCLILKYHRFSTDQIVSAFFALCRTISLALAFSACLDYLQKSKSTDQILTLGIKIMAGLIFVSMISSIQAIISQKVSRQGMG